MKARTAASEVVAGFGADPRGLVRLPAGTTSWVFDHEPAGLVVIVARPGRSPSDVPARVAAARVVAGRAPFVEPVGDAVVTSTGLTAVAWRRVATVAGRPDPAALGRSLRAFHDTDPAAVTGAGLALADLQTVEDLVAAVAGLRGRVPDRDAAALEHCVDRLGSELAALGPRPDQVLAHGDLHLGNVLTTADGAVLCDTDGFGAAPREWDLAFLTDPGRRAALTAPERAAFADAYGAPLPVPGTARTLARVAHLRRAVHLLDLPRPTPRERWWNRVRLGCWRAVAADWSRDEFPAFQLPVPTQLTRALRR